MYIYIYIYIYVVSHFPASTLACRCYPTQESEVMAVASSTPGAGWRWWNPCEAALHRNSKRKGPKRAKNGMMKRAEKGLKKGIYWGFIGCRIWWSDFFHIFWCSTESSEMCVFETTNSSVHFGLVQKGAHLSGHTEGPVARVICPTAGASVEATILRHDVTGMTVTRGNYTTMASVTLSSSYLVRSLQYFHKKWGLRLLTLFI